MSDEREPFTLESVTELSAVLELLKENRSGYGQPIDANIAADQDGDVITVDFSTVEALVHIASRALSRNWVSRAIDGEVSVSGGDYTSVWVNTRDANEIANVIVSKLGGE